MQMENFWIVIRDKPETYVSKRHYSLAEARAEAERLCRKEAVRFYVLRVVGCAEPMRPPVQWWVLNSLPGTKQKN